MTAGETSRGIDVAEQSATQETQDALGGLAAQIGVTHEATEQGEALQGEILVEDLRRADIEKNISELEGVENVEDLRALSVDQLISLEDKHEGILLYAFTDFARGGDALDLEHFAEFYRSPQPGAKLRVSFRGNAEAESKIGAADIFPPSVRRITIYRQGDTSRARTSTRRVGLKGRNDAGTGFYDQRGYMSIFSEDEVIIGGDKLSGTGVKMGFERKYRERVPGKPAERGALDYGKYQRERGTADQQFLGRVSRRAERSRRRGGAPLSRRLRGPMGLEEDLTTSSENIGEVLGRQPDLYRYASQARAKYRGKTGLDISESIMFGVTNVESSFGVMAKNPTSSATGLLQFTNGTWMDFLSANPDVKQRMSTDPSWKDVKELDWRFNPEIMMDAGYWLATRNMKYLQSKKNSIGYSEFRNSNFYKTGTVKAGDAWLLYLGHHEGPGGMVQLLKYQGLREAGDSRQQAASQVQLAEFQKNPSPDQHWRTVRDYSGRCERWARTYETQMASMDLASIEGDGTWGWVQASQEQQQVASGSERYEDPSVLDQLAQNPTLEGRTLLIGSSSTNGYAERLRGDIEVDSAQGRSIVEMNRNLHAMPLSELRSFDRVVLQGGVKNTDRDEATIGRSLRAIDSMVDYLRENAPGVKVYVTEVTPWNNRYDPKIREFNDHLNSPDFLARVDGVIPTYDVMDDGSGKLSSNFGTAGTLHVSRYDRYAGVIADWVTRRETAAQRDDGIDSAVA
jgi:hypothetical protein